MNKLLTITSAFIMIALVNFDMTIVNIALVNMAEFFHSNIDKMKITVGIYLFAASSSFIIFGKLADNWNRKWIFLIGVFLFVISSLLAGTTSNLRLFIFSRFIQGLGFSATLGQGVSFILRSFPANQQGFASGLAVLITGVAQAIGPTIGGVILQYWHWQGIFLINIPLGIIAFISGLGIEEKKSSFKKHRLRIINIVWFLISISSLLMLLNSIGNTRTFGIFLFCFGAFFIAFIYDCKYNDNGLIPTHMFRNYKYLVILWLRFLFMLVISSMLFSIPLYLQKVFLYSVIKTSFIMLYLTLALCITSLLVGKLVDHYGSTIFLQVAFILAIFSILLMLLWTYTFSISISAALILLGISFGVHSISSISGAIQSVKSEDKSIATGVFFTVSTLGASIGAMIAGNFMHLLNTHTSTFMLMQIVTHLFQHKNDIKTHFIVIYKLECIFMIGLMCVSTIPLNRLRRA